MGQISAIGPSHSRSAPTIYARERLYRVYTRVTQVITEKESVISIAYLT